MPNIIIHELVGLKIANKYKELDNKYFYLGLLSPDAVNLNGFASKEIRWTSHIRDKDLNVWRDNIFKFYKNNKSKYEESFIDGYFIHILTDIIFDDFFYDKLKFKFLKDFSHQEFHSCLLKFMDS